MKHLILLFSFCLITSFAFGQSAYQGGASTANKVDLRVYPNPTVDYIKVSNNDFLEHVALYNLAGRKIKTFNYAEGEKYYVGDLPKGMYLVQLIDEDRHTLVTRRINIR